MRPAGPAGVARAPSVPFGLAHAARAPVPAAAQVLRAHSLFCTTTIDIASSYLHTMFFEEAILGVELLHQLLHTTHVIRFD